MKISELLPLSLIAVFFSLVLFSFFLNYLSALYSDVNLFKIDLVKKRKDKTKVKKLIFILKNGNLLFTIVCFLQVFINIIASDIFMGVVSEILKERELARYRPAFLIGLSLFIALFTEIFVRYLVNRPTSREGVFNNFFLDFVYLLIRRFYYLLRPIVKPKKKIFANSEQDIIRFINNLTTENILEKKEAQLVQSAFRFDELKVNSIITPWKKVISLNKDMSYEEVQAVHSRHFFTRYPVINKKKEVVGIFNMEVFYWRVIKNKKAS
jgi:CBS domain containing-hemolysin-like protein